MSSISITKIIYATFETTEN